MGDVHLAEGGVAGSRRHVLDGVHNGRRMDDRRGRIVNDRSGFDDLRGSSTGSNEHFVVVVVLWHKVDAQHSGCLVATSSYRGRMPIIFVVTVSGRCWGGGNGGHQQSKDDLKTKQQREGQGGRGR